MASEIALSFMRLPRWGNEVNANLGDTVASASANDPLDYVLKAMITEPEQFPDTRAQSKAAATFQNGALYARNYAAKYLDAPARKISSAPAFSSGFQFKETVIQDAPPIADPGVTGAPETPQKNIELESIGPFDGLATLASDYIPSVESVTADVGSYLWDKVSASFDLTDTKNDLIEGGKYALIAVVGLILVALGILALIK